jgi:hypothetical protein
VRRFVKADENKSGDLPKLIKYIIREKQKNESFEKNCTGLFTILDGCVIECVQHEYHCFKYGRKHKHDNSSNNH